MSLSAQSVAKPDYGIDAPKVIRNLFVGGIAGLALWAATMNMQSLAFPDGAFDVILSCNAIHNTYDANGRAKPISELGRGLKPGGVALIEDIRHHNEYVACLAARGCGEAQWFGSRIIAVLCRIITFGSLSPGAIRVRIRQ